MRITYIPDPQIALDDLSPITPVLYGTLEAAAFLGHSYFAARDRKVDLHHHASTVRYEAKILLEEQGFPLEELANNGLSLTYSRYQIRILKADQGRVPCPGPSRKKQEFYRQLPLNLPSPLLPSVTPYRAMTNLLVIWDVTSTYALADLVLACPRDGDADRASAETYWKVTIPHPASTAAPEPPPPDADAEDYDLPIEPVEERKQSAGQAE